MKNLSAELMKVAALACRASTTFDVDVLTLRAAGGAITPSKRDELLAKCAAGEYVELEADLLAYEQKAGESNRNFVRFRDGAMMSLGRSGKNTPFLRDHNQYDSLSRGGTVIASSTEKRDEGDYAIRQTVKLTAPWIVELALRGLLTAVSIGWRPTGPTMCSACNAAIFTRCYHFPGDRLTERETEDGGKRKVRAADGDITVEWIFTEAELIETSTVLIGGVPTATFESIRTALGAEPSFRAVLAPDGDGFPEEQEDMKNLLPVLVATLSLAPTAGEDDVIKAVTDLKSDRDTKVKELAIADAENTKLSAIVETHRATERKADEDKFVHDALSSGRITKADEDVWRDLYQSNADTAKTRLAKRTAGSATPVGAPRQSDTVPIEESKMPTKLAADVNATLAANNVNPEAALHFAKKFGAKNAVSTIGKALGLNEEV
ncbi:MAG: hypothetical protein H0U52_06750 [Chloroflexi bacterium]|nr:hypothetical protein [Chloroflexota bacterium]